MLDEPTILRSSSPSQRVGNLRCCANFIRLAGDAKHLTSEQRVQAADAFGAEEQFPSAGKKLLDTSHPAFTAMTVVRNRIVSLW